MTIIGITGGTGAGKTTALSVLAERGALVIDCDAVYHKLTENSADLKADLEVRFPGVVSDGVLDRKALGARVFSDDGALLELNAITHRYVSAEVSRLLTGWESIGGRLAAVDAIALVESGLGKMCDFVVAVVAPPETRAERIMARDGISREYAMLRINAQKPESFFHYNCDYVLVNDCKTPDEFKDKCGVFFAGILGGKNNA